jgi:hypothetical protein
MYVAVALMRNEYTYLSYKMIHEHALDAQRTILRQLQIVYMSVHIYIHMNILSRTGVCDYRRGTGTILGLLTTYTHHTVLQLSTALSLI